MRRFLPLFLLLLVGCGSDEAARAGVVAPDFHVETLAIPSSGASLANKRGKVVLLDFWATWCGPCRMIAPALDALYAKHKGEGLEAMAISAEDRETVTRFERAHPRAVPVYLDEARDAVGAFDANSLPTLVVVDRKGKVVYYKQGVDETTAAGITDAVVTALAGG